MKNTVNNDGMSLPKFLMASFVFLCFTTALVACGAESGSVAAPAELEVSAVEIVTNEVAPLSAEAVFTTTVPARASVRVLGKVPVEHTVDALTTVHRVPILGLYPSANNQVLLRLESAESSTEKTLQIQTGPLPETFPTVTVTGASEAELEPGWNLSSLRISDRPDRASSFMFDPQGDIRWYLNLPASGRTTAPERFANGHIIYGFESTLYEYDMLGNQLGQWELPGYLYHHEIVEKPDGNLIVAVDKEGLATIEDFIVELDRSTGEIVREWDLRKVLDVNRRTFSEDEQDWLHVNAIWYDAQDDTLIVSGRHQGLAKITGDNRLVWLLAPHKGWGQNGNGENTADYLLTAVDAAGQPYPEPVQQGDVNADEFGWTWGQHAPMILPNGHLFVFDNGDNRNFSQDGPKFSRGVEYVLDSRAMTVRQVWQYGEERGDAFYSPIISDVDDLPTTSHRLIMPGIINNFGVPPAYALVTEVTYPGQEVVFEAKLEFKNLYEGETVFGDSIFRSERLPLYPPE